MRTISVNLVIFFFFNDTATTEIYTLSLHDALPIWRPPPGALAPRPSLRGGRRPRQARPRGRRERQHQGSRGSRGRRVRDRKSTRLNSSHANISYAVFCLKKKKTISKHISL